MRRSMLFLAIAGCFAATLTALPAHAEYGALAYDSGTRAWGRSYNQPTPRDADGVALSYCRSGGCQIVARTGPGQCGAIAAARYGTAYRWVTRYSQREAEYTAMEQCQGINGQPCDLIVVQCNR